ncbi:MAG TPA: RelA/SpoT domain-containing protein [Candidatus Omnitrophota bacterium]|nr:RelA/SpoT domain-containing protein [Candidatus Omnitrophota bacterium]
MANYAKFRYSKTKVDEAGHTLSSHVADSKQIEEAFKIINNWRSSHAWPMNVVCEAVKRYSQGIDASISVVQRLKRMTSVERKLAVFQKKDLKLSEMQDVGGCRAITKDVRSVYELSKRFKESQIKHKFEYENDYIADPKMKSGYRGLHLIYSYYSDKTKNFNGHRIEIQIRTQLQHAWATAVETVDTFTDQLLKSNQGEKGWREFFKIMATVMAKREGTQIAPGTPTDDIKIRSVLKQYDEQVRIIRSINETGKIIPAVRAQRGDESHYFLVILNSRERTASVQGFKKADSRKASDEYLKIERENAKLPHMDTVLVSAETIETLESAYRNYFLDMRVFAEVLEETLR